MKISRDVLRKLTPEGIKLAIRYGVLERRRESLQGRLDTVLKEMAKLEGNGAPRTRQTPSKASPAPVRRKRKRLSRATKMKMAASARKRWALAKGKTEPAKEVAEVK